MAQNRAAAADSEAGQLLDRRVINGMDVGGGHHRQLGFTAHHLSAAAAVLITYDVMHS